MEDAVRILLRIGLDDIRGFVTPADLAAYAAEGGTLVAQPTIDMAEMERRRVAGGVRVLDVRGRTDFDAAHVPGAQQVAHTRLLARLRDVPNDKPVLVHCASGMRAAHAVAMLEQHGYAATAVADAFGNWRAQG